MDVAMGQGVEKLQQRCGTGKLGLCMDQNLVEGVLATKGSVGIL